MIIFYMVLGIQVFFPEKKANFQVPIESDTTVLNTIITILNCYYKGNRQDYLNMDFQSVIFTIQTLFYVLNKIMRLEVWILMDTQITINHLLTII